MFRVNLLSVNWLTDECTEETKYSILTCIWTCICSPDEMDWVEWTFSQVAEFHLLFLCKNIQLYWALICRGQWNYFVIEKYLFHPFYLSVRHLTRWQVSEGLWVEGEQGARTATVSCMAYGECTVYRIYGNVMLSHMQNFWSIPNP